MLTLVSNCIDRLNVYNSAAHFGECAGSEAGAAWKDILNLLYELLGEMLVLTARTQIHTDSLPTAINLKIESSDSHLHTDTQDAADGQILPEVSSSLKVRSSFPLSPDG